MTGQFTQSDPIGIAGGLNTYGFAAGDPVSYADPYGLCPEEMRGGSGRCPGQLTVDQYNAMASAAANMTSEEAARWLHKLNNGYIVAGWHSDQLVRAHATADWVGESFIVINMNRPAGTTMFDQVDPGFIAITGSHEIGHVLQQEGMAGFSREEWWRRSATDRFGKFAFMMEQDADRHACANTTGTFSDGYCGRRK
ncbi:RHS repeat-associated core domain-containing protein [Longimicrobium sp.]|uniref:RHS repeat-associated core domain-containing protein n=1 Tax=Longimicrobium sp. TaxID=2029185 RepID=UPI003B3BB32F